MKTTRFAPILAVVVATLAVAPTTMPAQTSWTNRYNGPGNGSDIPYALAVDTNGNVFVTGTSTGSGSDDDYTTIKYSNDGMPLWTNRYNGPANSVDRAYALAVDGNGNVFVTGVSAGSGSDSDYATLKYSNEGVPLWTNRYNSSANLADGANAIALDGNGNVFVAGASSGTGFPSEGATIKYSNDGVPLWTNRYVGESAGIAVDGDGNVFVTGSAFFFGCATIKFSNGGMALWTNLYTGPAKAGDNPVAIAVDGRGSVFVTAYSYSSTNSDYATIKYSNNGVPSWTNRYNGSGKGYDYPYGMAVDGDGNVFVTGESVRSGRDYDYATIKYSNNGVPLWTNRYSGSATSTSRPQDIAVDGNGNVFVTGATGSDSDYYSATIKYSNTGVPVWTNLYNVQGSFLSIAADGNGNAFATGFFWDAKSGASVSDFVTIKYGAVPPPRNAILENPRVSGGGFSFDLTAEPGGQFAIQVSTDLVVWEAIRQVMIPAGGATSIVETVPPATAQRYYRAERK